MSSLRLILIAQPEGIFLFLRLPGGGRVLVDCAPGAGPPLALLRELGELGPLRPLTSLVRPLAEPDLHTWLGVLSLVRGLVLRSGGARLAWEPSPAPAGGFAVRARAGPAGPGVSAAGERPELLVLGLSRAEVANLGGPPQAWTANASLAVMLPGAGGDLLLGGDLRPAAWQRLLGRGAGGLAGVSRFAGGEPEGGHGLARGLVMAALPWLALGALAQSDDWRRPAAGPLPLATPEVGCLSVEVADDGQMAATAWPLDQGRESAPCRLAWQGLARGLDHPALPAPWPLRRALAEA